MKTVTTYKRSISKYSTVGSVFSTSVTGDSLQELDDELNKFIEEHKEGSEAITVGQVVVTTTDFHGGYGKCFLFVDEEEIKNNYLNLDYFKNNETLFAK